MKKIFLSIVLLLWGWLLHSQSLEQGKRQIYYERYTSAEQTFHQILKQNPADAEAWFQLVKVYLLQNKLSEAIDTLQKAPIEIQSDPYYYVAKGAVLLQQANDSEASRYFNLALKETKEKDAPILGAVAQANLLSEKGKPDYAVSLLNKAIKRDKRNPEWKVLLGDAYLKIHNGSEAYKAYSDAINDDGKYASAYHKIGTIFLSQNNPELYVESFQKAINADPFYAPSIYELYVYEFNRHPEKAMEYYRKFEANSDKSIQNKYDLADLFYINKNFDSAILEAKNTILLQGEKAQPRMYKMIGYSFAALKDSAKAITYMQEYFNHQPDSNEVAKDYESMGLFYLSVPGQDSTAMAYMSKATSIEHDSARLVNMYKKLATVAAGMNDFDAQSFWLGKYYALNSEANNVDLFNWGLASYRAADYKTADSVFGLYVSKYPEQSYGYYWQAKSKGLQDQDMKEGLAVPAYKNLIEVLEGNPQDPNYKKWLVEAYNYLAAYETNTEKNYAEAVSYFGKVLQVDPENSDAKKYIDILEKNLDDKGSK